MPKRPSISLRKGSDIRPTKQTSAVEARASKILQENLLTVNFERLRVLIIKTRELKGRNRAQF